MKRKQQKFLFAIDGVTGVGKTTVSKHIKKSLGAGTERIEAFSKYKKIRNKSNIEKLVKPLKTPDSIFGISSSILVVVPFAPLLRRKISSVKSSSDIASPAGHPSPHPPTWFHMAFFYDHFLNGRYNEALAEAHLLDWDGDFRIPLFVAASYGQLGRADEAAPALAEFRALWSMPVEDLRSELIERHAIAPELTDRLIEGLAKAGLEGHNN